MNRALSADLIHGLYRRYAADLTPVREAQRRLHARKGNSDLERIAVYRAVRDALVALGAGEALKPSLRPQLDDIEAEITYLLVRDFKPGTVVEVAPCRGWSTTWILQALRANGAGRLYSYDLVDYSTRSVPRELADGRWTFIRGDIQANLDRLPPTIDYLFVDAAHTAEFAHGYIGTLFPRLAPGTPVSVHDVFHTSDPAGHNHEGPVIVEWLGRQRIPFFTASQARAPHIYDDILSLKRELGIAEPIHASQRNSMIFFCVDG